MSITPRLMRWKVAVCVLLLTAFVVLLVIVPVSPEGRYTADKRIGVVGDFYWELARGKVEFVHDGGHDYFGKYLKTNAVWIWIDDRGSNKSSLRLNPSWWRLSCVDDATGQKETLGYRRFW